MRGLRIHLAGGAMWVALVAFSEYLARIHEQVLGRPLYVVERDAEVAVGRAAILPAGRSRTAA